MARYIAIAATTGVLEEVQPVTTSAGAGDSGKIPQLDGSGRLDASVMPTGVGALSITATAGEAIAAGDLVFITATGTIQKADRSNNRPARGFAPSAISNGASGSVFLDEGLISGLSGMTIGANQFLGTGGARTEAITTTAGQLHQHIGYAKSATELIVRISEPITRV